MLKYLMFKSGEMTIEQLINLLVPIAPVALKILKEMLDLAQKIE